MKCTKCGNEIRPGNKFCVMCGNPVVYQETGKDRVEDQKNGNGSSKTNAGNGKKKKSGKGWLVALIIILALLILGLAAFLGFKGVKMFMERRGTEHALEKTEKEQEEDALYWDSRFPKQPDSVKQPYYVIYNEADNSNRIEMAVFDLRGDAKDIYLEWEEEDSPILLSDRNSLRDCDLYFYDKEEDSWVLLEEDMDEITDSASEVISSNLDLCDLDGEVILEHVTEARMTNKIDYSYYDELADDESDDKNDNNKDDEKEAQEDPDAGLTDFEKNQKIGWTLLNDAPYLGNVTNISQYYIQDVSASSIVEQKGVDNRPLQIFDGRDDTNWQEGVPGYGIGESVNARFNRQCGVQYLALKLGNWREDKYFYGNGVPKTITISMNGFSQQMTFSNEKKIQWVAFDQPVQTDNIQIVINDVYPGNKWEDTSITDVYIYGN